MALDILSTSSINSLINQYTLSEIDKKIAPLQNRKSKYESISSSYGVLSGKLDSLKSLLENLKEIGSSSIFEAKKADSSDTSFISATVTSSVAASSYALRVNQLAKSDLLLTSDFTSSATNTLTGTHTFSIKTGDGSDGEFISTIDVTFNGSETNQTAMQKIQNAINSDKADILSGSHDASEIYTGSGSFVINVNGTEKTIDYDYSNMTYGDVVDDLVSKIGSGVDGVSAEKVVNGNDVQLKLSVVDSSQYITIDQTQDTGDLLSSGNLNLDVKKEKAASGLVTASLFSPDSSTSQLSLTAKETGLDFRIKELSDESGGTALSTFGLNIGSSRPVFDQSTNPDTAGFVYADITSDNNQLNSRFEFNGLNIQRNSNIISDLVNGMTLSLKSVMAPEDTTVTVNISNDVDSIKSKLKDFIEKFNGVYSYIKANSASSSGTRGVFLGDSNASSILNLFRTTSYANVEGIVDGNLNKLSAIGISFDSTTGLSISDETLMDQKLSENADQVGAIFNSAQGIANTLYDSIDPYLGIDGYLNNTQSRYDNNVKYLDDKITSAQTRIDKSAEIMRKKYQELQVQLASFLSTQSYFSQFTQGGL